MLGQMDGQMVTEQAPTLCPFCHLHVRYPYPMNSITRDLYAHEEIKQTSFGKVGLTVTCEQSHVVGASTGHMAGNCHQRPKA